MNKSIKINFITPCFCRGADCSDDGNPELRPASIRGQLHWWFRAFGYSFEDEAAIFGSVKKGGTQASRIVVRVREPDASKFKNKYSTLPHKQGGGASPKMAFSPPYGFELLISTRPGGLSPELEKKFDQALKAWLHLGALGLRATRGGGNFRWEEQPATWAEYQTALEEFPSKKFRTVILKEAYDDAEKARRIITDTLASEAFSNAPLGGIWPRKTSPLRFRIIELEKKFYIIAIWDERQAVTGNRWEDLTAAVCKLCNGNKPIGRALKEAGWGR